MATWNGREILVHDIVKTVADRNGNGPINSCEER